MSACCLSQVGVYPDMTVYGAKKRIKSLIFKINTDIVESPSIKAFERRIDRYCRDQDILNNFEVTLGSDLPMKDINLP